MGRYSSPLRPGSAGFTLIELMVTIAVIAVMLVLAAPSFITFQKNSQLTSAANTLLASLSAARAEAMKRQLNVYVRPMSAGDWTQGWTVYVDTDWDGAYTAGTDVLVTSQPALAASVTALATPVPPQYVMFAGDGFVRSSAGAMVPSQAIGFTNSTGQRLLVVSPSGRIRVCVPDATSCNVADPI